MKQEKNATKTKKHSKSYSQGYVNQLLSQIDFLKDNVEALKENYAALVKETTGNPKFIQATHEQILDAVMIGLNRNVEFQKAIGKLVVENQDLSLRLNSLRQKLNSTVTFERDRKV
jgi:regulator of replication initiation timing